MKSLFEQLFKTKIRTFLIAISLGYFTGNTITVKKVEQLINKAEEVKAIYDEMTAPAEELIKNNGG